jgi:hypothetical protein
MISFYSNVMTPKPFYALLGFFHLVPAHFQLNYPYPLGFIDSTEDQGPCGGYMPNPPNITINTLFNIGGDAIWITGGASDSNVHFSGELERECKFRMVLTHSADSDHWCWGRV